MKQRRTSYSDECYIKLARITSEITHAADFLFMLAVQICLLNGFTFCESFFFKTPKRKDLSPN